MFEILHTESDETRQGLEKYVAELEVRVETLNRAHKQAAAQAAELSTSLDTKMVQWLANPLPSGHCDDTVLGDAFNAWCSAEELRKIEESLLLSSSLANTDK